MMSTLLCSAWLVGWLVLVTAMVVILVALQSLSASACTSGHIEILTDPNGGTFGSGTYFSNSICMWRISITPPPSSSHNSGWINLRFLDFHLENNFDLLYLFDGHNESAPQILKWSGIIPPAFTFSSSGPILYIALISDSSLGGNGFNASYTYEEPCSDNGGTIYEWKRSIDFALTTPDDAPLSCTWKFGSFHSEIHFFPSSLTLTSADSLQIFDDFSASRQLASYIGENATIDISPIVSSGIYMMVHFQRALSVGNTSEFHATFQTGSCKPNEVTHLIGTHGIFTDGSGYGEAYRGNNYNCYWLIEKPTSSGLSSIALKFSEFQLRDNDAVVVYDGQNVFSPIITTWTTAAPPGDVVAYGSSSKMLVQFVAGPLVSHTNPFDTDGFSASYELADPCSEDGLVYYTSWSHIEYRPAGNLNPSSSSTQCKWLIYTKNPISLYTNWVSLQTHEVLNIYEGSVPNPSSLIASLTGHDDLVPSISIGNTMLLVLVSQGPRNLTSHFSATYQAGICQGFVAMTAPHGTFTDGRNNNERPYPHECQWMIRVPSGNIALDFDFVDIGTDEWIRVTDLHSSQTLLDVSGVAHPPRIFSSGNMMRVRYHLNTATRGSGFIARYYSGFPAAPAPPQFSYQIDKLTVWWDAPSDEGASPIIGYSVRCFDDMIEDFVEIFRGDEYSNKTVVPMRLIIGKRYTCNVIAINFHGESAPSSDANFIIHSFAKMPIITLSALPTSSEISVQIEAPPGHNYGGYPTFEIERDNGSGTDFIKEATITQTASVPISRSLTGLKPETKYRVRARVSVTGITVSEYALLTTTTQKSAEQHMWDLATDAFTVLISAVTIFWVGIISAAVLVGSMLFFRKRARTKQLVHHSDVATQSTQTEAEQEKPE